MDKRSCLQRPANKIPTELDKSLNVNSNRSLKRPVNAKLGKLSLLFPRLVRIYLSLSFCKGKCGSSYLFLQSSADEQIRWTNCWNGRGVYIPLCGNSSLKIVRERMSPRLNSSEVIIFSSVPMEMFPRSAYYWQILKGFSRTKAISSIWIFFLFDFSSLSLLLVYFQLTGYYFLSICAIMLVSGITKYNRITIGFKAIKLSLKPKRFTIKISKSPNWRRKKISMDLDDLSFVETC